MESIITAIKDSYGEYLNEEEIFPIRYQPVDERMFSIGRASLHASKKDRTCNPKTFYFEDRTISMEHVLIEYLKEACRFRIMDTESTHGSAVFNRKNATVLQSYESHYLDHGDFICLTLNKNKSKIDEDGNYGKSLSRDQILSNTKVLLKFLVIGDYVYLVRLDSSKVLNQLTNSKIEGGLSPLYCEDYVYDLHKGDWIGDDTSVEDEEEEEEGNNSAPEIDVLVKAECIKEVENESNGDISSDAVSAEHSNASSESEEFQEDTHYDPETQFNDDSNSQETESNASSSPDTESVNEDLVFIKGDIPDVENLSDSDDYLHLSDFSEGDVDAANFSDCDVEADNVCVHEFELNESSSGDGSSDESEISSSDSSSSDSLNESELDNSSAITEEEDDDDIELCVCDDCSYLNSFSNDSKKRKYDFVVSDDESDYDDNDDDDDKIGEPDLKKRKTEVKSSLKKDFGLLVTGITIGSIFTFAGLAALGSSMS